MPDLVPGAASRLGRAFTAQSDLVPLYLLRFDRENTRRAYRKDIESFFGSEVVTLEMASAVTFSDVNEALQALDGDGKSPATQRRFIASLRGFFAWLTALGFLDLNPADRHLVRRVAKTAITDDLVTVLTRDQARDLLAAVDLDRETGPRDYALVSVLLNCVLRRSEASAMNVEDLRQSGTHAVVQIRRAKGGANQVVKIPPRVASVLQSFIETQGYRSGPVWRSFSTNASRGRRLSGSSIYKIVRTLGERAGISERVGAHTLRHTGCTLAIENGASLQQVQSPRSAQKHRDHDALRSPTRPAGQQRGRFY